MTYFNGSGKETKMALREELERQGAWFFRWRSYIPLFMIVLFILALRRFNYPMENHKWDQPWELFCFAISLLGLGLRGFATSCAPRGTSGRNTKGQAATVLNTTGLYSVVRHPLYLGNFLIWFGVALSVRSWWFVSITTLLYWIYYERIIFAEEEFLRRKFGDDYLAWANKAPTFFPRWSQWRAPELPFSWRNALRREYSGFFGIISVFSILDMVEEFLVEKHLTLDPIWVVLFPVGIVTYLTLMFLKKKTKILNVAGR